MNIKNNGKYSLRPEIKINYLSAKGKKVGEMEEKTGRILQNRTAAVKVELKDLKGEAIEVNVVGKGKVLYSETVKLK